MGRRLVSAELAAAAGAYGGWRYAFARAMPRISCKPGPSGQRIATCFNRSITATVFHYGVPMLVGFLLAGAASIALVIAARMLRSAKY